MGLEENLANPISNGATVAYAADADNRGFVGASYSQSITGIVTHPMRAARCQDLNGVSQGLRIFSPCVRVDIPLYLSLFWACVVV